MLGPDPVFSGDNPERADIVAEIRKTTAA